MIEKLKKRIARAIEEKVFPGCVIGFISPRGTKTILAAGQHTYDKNDFPVKENSIFDVASITKSIPTACLALQFIDRGKLKLDDKLTKYILEFRNSEKDNVTVWHLLTHTLDFGHIYLSQHKDKSPKEILDLIFATEFISKPGEKYWYMNATSILLGLVIQKIARQPLDDLADKEFFKPLKMNRTTFHPEKFLEREVVPTEIDEWRGGLVRRAVHDESAYTLQKEFIPGHAGLFSTTEDLLTFLEMILNKGVYKNTKYFSEDIIGQMFTNQLSFNKESTGLGWELNQPLFMGKHASEHTFGKTGFTGCMIVGDINRKIGIVFLSNAVHPKRPPTRDRLNEVRCDIADIILETAV